MKIPFLKTTLGDKEIEAITKVIKSQWVVMGPKTVEFEKKFAKYVGAKYAVFVDSGTAALFLALKWWVEDGRETVKVPSLTFTSTAEVVRHAGCKIKFVDVDRNTMCLEQGGTAVIAVHLTGVKSSAYSFIYDSAHRIEKDDVKGSNALWCYSFYATKNMTTVQGGMIALNSKIIYDWFKKARDHGITKGTEERYKKGSVFYDIEFVGWRLKSDDIHAAIGLEQLKKLPAMTRSRNRIVEAYNRALGLNRTGNHIYPILVNNRAKFVNLMKKKGVQCSIHFLPLHKMTAYKDCQREPLPNTEYLGERLVSIPLYPDLTNKEIDYVVKSIKETGLLIT